MRRNIPEKWRALERKMINRSLHQIVTQECSSPPPSSGHKEKKRENVGIEIGSEERLQKQQTWESRKCFKSEERRSNQRQIQS